MAAGAGVLAAGFATTTTGASNYLNFILNAEADPAIRAIYTWNFIFLYFVNIKKVIII